MSPNTHTRHGNSATQTAEDRMPLGIVLTILYPYMALFTSRKSLEVKQRYL